MTLAVDTRETINGELQRLSARARVSQGTVCLLSGSSGIGKTAIAQKFLMHLAPEVVSLAGRGLPTGTPSLLPICTALARFAASERRPAFFRDVERHARSLPLMKDILTLEPEGIEPLRERMRQVTKQLRGTLTRLFPDIDSVRILVSDAGMPLERINWSGKPEVLWHNVLDEALKQGPQTLLELLEQAQERYPREPKLRYFIEEFQLKTARKPPRSEVTGANAPGRSLLPMETYSFVVLAKLLRSIRDAHPLVVLFIDDLQWLDASSAAFLAYVVQELSELPLLLLLTARTNGVEPKTLSSLKEAVGAVPADFRVQMTVPPLSIGEIAAAASQSLGGPVQFAPDDLEWLCLTSKGNPKHLNEVLLLLRERGGLQFEGGIWKFVRRPDRLVVPPSLAAIVIQRFEQAYSVAPVAEELLYYAAVYGQEFDVCTLAQCVEIHRRDALSVVRHISRTTGYVRQGRKDGFFEFDHDLTREALLESLGSHSRTYHERMAVVFASDDKTPAVQVAYQFRRAGDAVKAAEYYGRGAIDALAKCAFRHAVECAEQQDNLYQDLGLDASSDKRIVAANLQAQAYIGAERYQDAVGLLRDRLRDVSLDDTRLEPQYLLGIALSQSSDDGAHREAIPALKNALMIAERAGDPVLTCKIWTELVYAYDSLGAFEKSQAAFRKAFSAASEAKDPASIIRLLRLTCVFWQPEKVAEATSKALKLARKHEFQLEVAYCLNNLGTTSLYLQRLPEASAYLDKSLAQLIKFGDIRTDIPLNNLGVIELLQKNMDKAERFFEQAERACLDRDNRIFIGSNKAILLAEKEQLQDAILMLRDLVAQADETGDLFYRDTTRHNLALALLKSGRPGEAISVATECPPHHWTTNDALIRGRRAVLLLECHKAQGQETQLDRLSKEAGVLTQTTKQEAWLFRLGWNFCDIQFW